MIRTDKNARRAIVNRALERAMRPNNLEMSFMLSLAMCALIALGGCASNPADQRVDLAPPPPFQEVAKISMNTVIDASDVAAIQPAAGASLAAIAAIRNKPTLSAAEGCDATPDFSEGQALAYDGSGGRLAVDVKADNDRYITTPTPGGYNGPNAMATLRYSVSLQKAKAKFHCAEDSLWQGVQNLRDRIN